MTHDTINICYIVHFRLINFCSFWGGGGETSRKIAKIIFDRCTFPEMLIFGVNSPVLASAVPCV